MDATIIIVLGLNCTEPKACDMIYASFNNSAQNLLVDKPDREKVIKDILKEKR